MHRTTLLSLLFIAALCGCASSGTTGSSNVPDGSPVAPTTRIVGVQSSMDLRTNPSLSRGVVVVDAPLAEVWRALVAAYDSVGIPVTISMPAQGLIGNDGYKLRRRLKDVPLTRYLDCGSTQGGPSAETYEVLLMVRTQLRQTPDGVTATTLLDASARPVAISGDYVKCGSTGRLEARIGELIGGTPPGE